MDQRLFLIRALLTDRREDYDSKIIDLTQKFFDLVYTRHAAALEALYQQRTRMHPPVHSAAPTGRAAASAARCFVSTAQRGARSSG